MQAAMKRDIESKLIAWKESQQHLPILLRGARQVGKSYLIEAFGRQYFDDMVMINFELQPKFMSCFETLEPKNILEMIEVFIEKTIIPGKTLLFLDEVQECPNVIMALRYFKELLPELHVIAAGSLLDFTLKSEDFRMPVGRVQFYYLYPLSFKEFLSALGREKLRVYIENIKLKDKIPVTIHSELLNLVKQYCILGGMPAVLNTYIQTESMKQAQDMQTVILTNYQSDFAKYAKKVSVELLQEIFNQVPFVVTNQLKYTALSRDVQSRTIKQALTKLLDANILRQVFSTNAMGPPLNAQLNLKKFKLLFVDTGLIERTTRLDTETLLKEDLILVNNGMIAEHFVGQELLAYQNPLLKSEVYFWDRDKKSSNAEVDYVISVGDKIIPIEVKAGSTGRLKSLYMFIAERKLPIGIHVSSAPFSAETPIMKIPFYLVSELGRFVNVTDSKDI